MIMNKKPLMGMLSGMSPTHTVHGDDPNDPGAIMRRMRERGLDPTQAGYRPQGASSEPMMEMPSPQGDQGQPSVLGQRPSAPPSARSTNPWSKENRSRTLLDIGAAFLSEKDFFSGMGRAASGLGQRMDNLRQEAEPDSQFGVGPGGQFEVVTGPDGQRSVNRIPEFQKAMEEDRAYSEQARNRVSPQDAAEQRSQVLNSILQLPQGQQEQAYAQLLNNPSVFGLQDAAGLPQSWDPTFAEAVSGSGLSVSQSRAAERQQAAFIQRQRMDQIRAEQGAARVAQGQARVDQGQQRITSSPANRAPSSPRPPSGFILD